MTEVETRQATAEEARRLTDRIKIALEGTYQLLIEAYQSRSWAVLGYDSWDDYCTREFGTSRLRPPREDRQEVVASLREAGLSLRAIAAATQQSEATVRRDLSTASPPQENDAVDEQSANDNYGQSRGRTGLDGRVRPSTRPKPQPEPLDPDGWPTDEPDATSQPVPAPPTPTPRPAPVMLTLRTHTGEEVPYPKPQAKATFNETTGEGISWAAWSWNPVTGCLHGCDYCLTPDTPVLMADLTWRPIGDIRPGDQVAGFDEESPQGVERRWRTAEVTAAWRTLQPAFRITFEDDREITASAGHKWLCDRNTWRTTETLRPGSKIRAVFPPAAVAQDEGYEAGYIAGVTLGDGTFRWGPSWRSDKLGFPQSYWRVAVLESDRAILGRLREYLAHVGVDVSVRPFQGGLNPMVKVETRRLANMPIIGGLCQEQASDTWWAGWLAGMFDAEGATSGGSLRISQKDVAVLDAFAAAGARLGFTFKVEKWENSTPSVRLVGDAVEQARFLAAVRPALTRKGPGLEGRKVRTGMATVRSVARSVNVELVDITTSTRTFVADGMLTHNCYARAIATRFTDTYPAGFTPLFHEQRLDAPANTTIPAVHRDDTHQSCDRGDCKICAYRRVFVCSMADLYGRWVPDEWIKQVHESMLATPDWQYILLTKFPARYTGLDLPPGALVGTSIDEQKRVRIAEKAFAEMDVPRNRKWLSLEPLREPLKFTDLSMFGWVVIGAQTETRQPDGPVPAFAPPIEWVARLIVQALDAGCKVHLKPNLRGQPGMGWLDQYPTP